jgi:hypothetical protein
VIHWDFPDQLANGTFLIFSHQRCEQRSDGLTSALFLMLGFSYNVLLTAGYNGHAQKGSFLLPRNVLLEGFQIPRTPLAEESLGQPMRGYWRASAAAS